MGEGVELPVLAAGVDIGREVAEKILVVGTAGEDGIEDVRVHTDEDGLKAEVEKTLSSAVVSLIQRGKTASRPSAAIWRSR